MEKNPREIRPNSYKREWDDRKDNVLIDYIALTEL